MKKINKSSSCPEGLADFARQKPDGTWEDFCKNSTAKREVQQQIRRDQRGLCAYCEIDLLEIPAGERNRSGDGKKADFRVDHFHPKSNHTTPAQNWALDWQNLFGVCAGGDEKNVIEPERFSETKSNRHCDSVKGNKNLDGSILNPLTDVPAFPCLWDCDFNAVNQRSTLKPNKDSCQLSGPAILKKAENTLMTLHLNCDLLAKFRWAALNALQSKIKALLHQGIKVDDAIEEIMMQTFDNSSPTWPAFFSTIRAYYGIAAEERLKAIGYNG